MMQFIKYIVKNIFAIGSENTCEMSNGNEDAKSGAKEKGDTCCWRYLSWQEHMDMDEEYRRFYSLWDD